MSAAIHDDLEILQIVSSVRPKALLQSISTHVYSDILPLLKEVLGSNGTLESTFKPGHTVKNQIQTFD